jgi:hypothetical protein
MFNYLCKTFLITILSSSLTLVQTNMAYAGVTETTSPTTTDKNGIITANKQYHFDGVQDENMLASLGMLAGGFITGRMIQAYSPVTNDVMVAGAAGVAFIAGEVMSNMKFKGDMDAMSIEVSKKSDGKINEEQLQRLTDLRESYEKAKDATSTKKKLQLASAVAFGVAAAMATYMAMTEEGLITACETALAGASKSMAACIASGATGVGAAEAGACTACEVTLGMYATNYKTYNVARKVPGNSAMKDKQVVAAEAFLSTPVNYCSGFVGKATLAVAKTLAATCGKSMGVLVKNQVDADIAQLKLLVNNDSKLKSLLKMPYYSYYEYENFQSKEKSFLEKSLNYIIPEARAGWLPLLGLGAGTAAAFFLITGTTAVEIDMMMFVPQNRAFAFAALGGVAFLASRSSANVIDKIEENIKKIDEILANLNKNPLGVKAQNIKSQPLTFHNAKTNQKNTTPTNGNKNTLTPCMTSNDSTNCKPAADQLTSMPGFGNLPESFRNVASQSVKLGDSLSGADGVSGSALSSADALGKKQAAVSSLLKSRQEALKKLTNGKVDAEKGKAGFLKALGASVKKSLRKQGMTATGMMASMGVSPIAPSADGKSEGEGRDVNPLAANGVNVGGAPIKDQNNEEGMKLDFSEAPAENNVAAVGDAKKAKEYDIDTNEISNEDGPSIFELISSRYIKSGYPKLLEEEPAEKK